MGPLHLSSWPRWSSGDEDEIPLLEAPFGILNLLLQNVGGNRVLVDVEQGHVVIGDFVEKVDEFDEVGVRLLPERFLALPK